LKLFQKREVSQAQKITIVIGAAFIVLMGEDVRTAIAAWLGW
jgi:hypothetical protein